MSSSLPNSDDDSVVSDQTGDNVYVVRLTPQERYSLEDLLTYLREMDNSSWILCTETKPKLHYHLIIENEDSIEDMKARIRSFLYIYWPDGERKRGWGNAQYNIQVCEDKQRAISYALKDREEYHFEGYEQDYIDWCLEQSFSKNSPSTFKVEYQQLCKDFQESDMDIREFMIKFTTLKAKYGQQVRLHDAYSYALSNLIKREPLESEELVEKYLYNI